MWNLLRVLPLTLIAAASSPVLTAQQDVMVLLSATGASGSFCSVTPACSYGSVDAAPAETVTLWAKAIGAPFLVFASPAPTSPCASIPGIAGSLVLAPPVVYALELQAMGRIYDSPCISWFARQQIFVPPLVPRGSRLYLQGLALASSGWMLTNAIELKIR